MYSIVQKSWNQKSAGLLILAKYFLHNTVHPRTVRFPWAVHLKSVSHWLRETIKKQRWLPCWNRRPRWAPGSGRRPWPLCAVCRPRRRGSTRCGPTRAARRPGGSIRSGSTCSAGARAWAGAAAGLAAKARANLFRQVRTPTRNENNNENTPPVPQKHRNEMPIRVGHFNELNVWFFF